MRQYRCNGCGKPFYKAALPQGKCSRCAAQARRQAAPATGICEECGFYGKRNEWRQCADPQACIDRLLNAAQQAQRRLL